MSTVSSVQSLVKQFSQIDNQTSPTNQTGKPVTGGSVSSLRARFNQEDAVKVVPRSRSVAQLHPSVRRQPDQNWRNSEENNTSMTQVDFTPSQNMQSLRAQFAQNQTLITMSQPLFPVPGKSVRLMPQRKETNHSELCRADNEAPKPVILCQFKEDEWNKIGQEVLIDQTIKRKNGASSLKERIRLLVGCIEFGERQFAKIDREAARSPILFLGNTGAGKSTIINYLSGCEMEYTDSENIGLTAAGSVVVVKENSSRKEIMKIGHSQESETFLPSIVSTEGRAYCDCPGFLESRGVEMNVANIINIKRVITSSESIRLVVLINYHSLRADRSRGLKETVNIATQFFSSREVFRHYKNSILAGVTKVGEKTKNMEGQSLKSLKSWILEEKVIDAFESEIVHALVENLFIYDPLDEVDLLYYSGGLTRKQLLEKIDQMPSIAQGENYFSTVITANDEKELRKICDGIAQEIQESLDHHLYRDVNFLLKHVYRIRKIDHPIVEDLIGECKNLIIKHFQSLIQEVDEELLRDSSTLSEKAKKIVDVISVGISSFEGEDPTFFAEKIGLEQLKKKYSNHEKTIQFWQFESQTKLLVAEFRQKCSNGDLAGAQTLLSSIENRVIEVNKDFASQQLSSTIDAHDLRTQFEKLRTMKNQLEAMQFKHQQEAAANRDQILALEANRAEEKRRFEAAQADQERQANALFAQLNSL